MAASFRSHASTSDVRAARALPAALWERPLPLFLWALLATLPALALEKGDALPAATLARADGSKLALSDLRGRVVIVDFWASWCGPCRESFPFLDELRTKHGDTGLTVVGVNLDEERSEAQRFLDKTPVTFDIVYDAEATTPPAFGVKAMPSTYVFGRDGKLRAVHLGFRDSDRASLAREVEAALAEARAE